jgi:hypothetical protein
MSKKYKFADNDKIYFVSFAVTNWIDLFIRNEYGEESGTLQRHYINAFKLTRLKAEKNGCFG